MRHIVLALLQVITASTSRKNGYRKEPCLEGLRYVF